MPRCARWSASISRRCFSAAALTVGQAVVRSAPVTTTDSGTPSGRIMSKLRLSAVLPSGTSGFCGVVLRAEQPLLLRGDGEEEGGPLRLRRLGRPRAGEFEQQAAAGGVVRRAVVDRVAEDGPADAEVVPVGREDDGLRLERRVAALDHADDVVADDLLDAGRDVALQVDAERVRLEPLRVGLLRAPRPPSGRTARGASRPPRGRASRRRRAPAGRGRA